MFLDSKFIIPDYLNKGDKIRIISPAGNVDPDYVLKSKSILEELGFIAEISEYALSVDGRFAGTDTQRAKDINDAFSDKDVKAILCTRGGYGVVRLIGLIDESIIKENPKWLLGYSDITALHQILLKNGIASLHCQMTSAISKLNDTDSVKEIINIISGDPYSIKITAPSSFNINGETQGYLCGGNLAVISGLRGTEYDFDYENKILFIEDIGESPYKIDRFIQNLRIGKVFEKIKGLIIGQFTDCGDSESLCSIYNNIHQIVKEYGFPVCFDFPVGHVDNNMPMVEGGKVSLKITDEYVLMSLERNI